METTDHRIRPKSCRRHGLDRNPHLLLLLWLLFLLLLLLYELVARTADPVDLQAILFGVGASAAHARHPRLQAAQLRQFGVRIALADRAALTALAVSRPAVAIRRTAGRQRCSSKGRERAKRERKGQRGERRLRRPLLGTLPSLVFLYVDRFIRNMRQQNQYTNHVVRITEFFQVFLIKFSKISADLFVIISSLASFSA